MNYHINAIDILLSSIYFIYTITVYHLDASARNNALLSTIWPLNYTDS